MPESVSFHTKGQLAQLMLQRAVESGVSFAWVAGDEVYGNDRKLRLWLERLDLPHVLAIKSTEKLWALTEKGPRQIRADHLVSQVDEAGWSTISAGNGAKGPRVYDWTTVKIRPLQEPAKGYWLWPAAALPNLRSWLTTCALAQREQPWRNWPGWPELAGPSRNALNRPRER